MDAQELHLSIDYAGTSGIILSPEQKASLQTSLTILQSNMKLSRVYFWGKIYGTKEDYLIAQGVEKDEFQERKMLYSQDYMQWALLPPATEEMKTKAHLAKGMLTGDPSYEFEHTEVKKIGEGEEVTEEEETTVIKEEERLSAVLTEIDMEARIVPRGAYVKTPTGAVFVNRSFEGLSVAEAAKLGNYFHFRPAIQLHLKTLLQRANLDKSIDFMDAIDEDIPKGSWSIQFERGSGLVTVRCLLWPGYSFFHVPGTRRYGSIYVGCGQRNLDIPFML